MKQLQGIPASNGIAIGHIFLYQLATPVIEQRTITDPATEISRLETAVAAAGESLLALKAQIEASAGAAEAEIFEVHRMFLADPAFIDEIKQAIESDQVNAEVAVDQTANALISQFMALEDEYFRQRAADIKDVSQRLLRLLTGMGESSLARLTEPVIILAEDLTPSDTASANRAKILAFCTAGGGATSHTAILARSLNIPAVVGLGHDLLHLAADTELIVDGETGELWLNPDAETIVAYQQRRQAQLAGQAEALQQAHAPAITRDGHQVEIVANIGSLDEAHQAMAMGAEGVGLLRTEFIFLQRNTLPTEEEQYQIYRAMADVFQQLPLIVRTLDAGGDKEIPYLNMPPEQNPFLGRRAIRLCLAEPELFQTQLRAILRASYRRNIKIMFPMISSVSELRQALNHLDQAKATLAAQNIPFDPALELGIMVEIPSAALLAPAMARLIDFFSIGTNDLTQYTLAVDRTNAAVAPLADPLHPAVLQLIQQVIQAAHAQGKWVGMCGELAGSPQAIPLLLGMGLDEFSMTASAIPAAKALIRTLTTPQTQRLAQHVLTLSEPEAIHQFLSTALISSQ
jgi:phosphoenolpyruvate-protein phosphotransferase